MDAGNDVAAHLLEVFQEFDTDGNGRIDATELRAMMERVGLSMTRDEAAEVLEEMDEICQGLLATATQAGSEAASKFEDFEDDGEVSFEEFYAVLMKLEGARAYAANSVGAATGGGSDTTLTIRSIAGTIDQLRARREQKKRWRSKKASGFTLQDATSEGQPVSKLDEDKRQEIGQSLSNVPLLATLAPPAKAQLLDLLVLRGYRKGQDIVQRGEEGNEFYMILKGRVHVLSEAEDVIAELGQGKHFGERSLIISEPRNATVRCAEECEVVSMHRVGFTQILDKIGEKERERRRRLAERKQMEDKRRQREEEKAERARAREQSGRQRLKGRFRRFSAIDDWAADMEEKEAQERARKPDDLSARGLAGVKRRVRRASVEMLAKVKGAITGSSSSAARPESDSSEDEFDQEADLPPAKELLKATLAELDSLLGEQAKRHEPAERSWERALAARTRLSTPAMHAQRRSSSSLSTLPAIDTSAGARVQDIPAPVRRRRGGVGAAGQTLVMGTVGVPRSLDAVKRKASSVRTLPALELRDPARDRRVRAAKFRSTSSKALSVVSCCPDTDTKMPFRYPWTSSVDDTEIDGWLGEIGQ